MGLISDFLKGKRIHKDVEMCKTTIGLAIATIVMDEYEQKPIYKDVSASVFGAQVMNYLMGTYIDSVLTNVSPEVRDQIIKIKDKVVPEYSIKLLERDKEIRETVVLYLQQFNNIARAYTHSEAEFNNLPERKQVDAILNKFGGGMIYGDPREISRLVEMSQNIMGR